jgi:signal peptidase II
MLADLTHSGSEPTRSLRQWFILAGITALVVLIDQLSKAYVVAHLDYHHSWMPLGLIKPVFRFTHVHNTGAAFGLFPQGGLIFLIIAVFVSVIIVFYYRQIPAEAWLVRVALGFQLGGALGNVIDRVRLGYVVDFFDVSIWPVFNVADSCIVIGVALLALEMLREEWQAKQAAKREAADDISDQEQAYS